MMAAEWTQLGKGKRGKPVYYRKKELYTMEWTDDDINLSDCLVACGKYGGPIATTRDPRKMLRLRANDSKQYISIYSCAGRLLSRFEWNTQARGTLTHLGWSDDELLICINDDAHVFLYDIHGKSVSQFSFVTDVKDAGILQVATWGAGIAILTKDFKLWVVSELDSPFCVQYARIPVGLDYDDEKDVGMSVIPEDQSPNRIVEVVVSVPQSSSIFIVSKDRCADMRVDNGPFPRLTVSPSGEAVATFTEEGGLWVVKSDFSENHTEFNTRANAPPHQVAWCGEDSVCLYWEPEQINKDGQSLLLMIGPNGDFQKFTYEGPISLVTEIDGVRIITNDTCEFLHRVPDPTFDIFRIGSLTPSAMLFDAYVEYEKKNAASIKNIRSIRAQLPIAVRNCLAAAANEFDASLQRKLLKAAAYGKSFCEEFNHTDFVNTCKVLRVMNAVRDAEIGIPITFEQYNRLTPNVLIDRLVARMHHLLAYRICEYLRIKPANVLVHWACSKVRTEEAEANILKGIKSKLKICEGVSYATVASTAYRVGKKDLAISLLEKEERAGEQVPLLLNMGETKKALQQAINSGETDLIYLVLLHMKKKLEASIFFSIINEKGFEIARDLLVAYCKEQDMDFLLTFYHALELPHEAAAMSVLESFESENMVSKLKLLGQAKDLFSKRREFSVDAKASDQQRTLLELQSTLDQQIGKQLFTGLSVSDTIYNCILIGDKREKNIKDTFHVPDKRYWYIKIAAYSKLGKWSRLEKLAKKKSPIGYKPFVEACMKRGNNVEALKYIPKVTDPWEKVELYVELMRFKEAIEVAYSKQDVDMLHFIKAKSNHAKTKSTIDDLIAKLV